MKKLITLMTIFIAFHDLLNAQDYVLRSKEEALEFLKSHEWKFIESKGVPFQGERACPEETDSYFSFSDSIMSVSEKTVKSCDGKVISSTELQELKFEVITSKQEYSKYPKFTLRLYGMSGKRLDLGSRDLRLAYPPGPYSDFRLLYSNSGRMRLLYIDDTGRIHRSISNEFKWYQNKL